MAKFYSNFKVTVNGTDLSQYLSSVELTTEADELEVTAFGTEWRERISGLKTGTISMDFFADYAASAASAVINPLLGTIATVVVQSNNGTVSSVWPKYTGTFLCTSVTPVAGAVGDVSTFSVSWPTSGTVTTGTA